MTYEPRTYWTERPIRQGASYVGPGGDPERSEAEGQLFADVVSRLMPKGRCVLDFGCGSGRLTRALLAKATEYVGVDISASGILLAPDIPDATYVHMRGDTIPLPDRSVDIVCAAVVFQHIVDDADLAGWCAEIRRVLAPGGSVLVIDHRHMDRPAAHMRPRGAAHVGGLLGLDLVRFEAHNNHWVGVFS